MIKDQMTYDFVYSMYKNLISDSLTFYRKFLKFDFPKNEKRLTLMTRLWGTQILESIFILNYLHKSLPLEGDVCEFGVAQGATSAFIANEISHTNKKLWLFDSFKGLPKPSEKDLLQDDIFNLGDIKKYEGTMACEIEQVIERLSEINFPTEKTIIIPGFIEQTIKEASHLTASVCFAYVDFDFYEPSLIALEFLNTVLAVKGYIVIDDYKFFSSGIETAVKDFLNKYETKYKIIVPDETIGRFCILQKIKR